MGQALYRAHRPKKLAEVVGQEHVTTALDRALKKGTISHAYLLTGPRGTGKTSIGRILAHEINGLPYEDDSTHLDIIEIDAASNRRIDEIRNLRDKVHLAPTSATYKVYIIDEVHMLTKEAFNALLKTLEEPPAHVVFILATTEAHKLPETIISRTQRFALKPVELPKVIEHLRSITKAEKINISDNALALIATHGEGSFRDSISLLDQVRNTSDAVELADVEALLGIAPEAFVQQVIDALAAHDVTAVAASLQHMHAAGYEPAQIARQLGAHLRGRLLKGTKAQSREVTMQLLTRLLDVPSSADPKSYLEIALLDAALADTPTAADTPASRPHPVTAVKPKATSEAVQGKSPGINETEGVSNARASQHGLAASKEPKVISEEVRAKNPTVTEPHPSSFQKAQAASQNLNEPDEPDITSDVVLNTEDWTKVLAAVKAKHNTLFSIVRVTTPHFEPGIITLECGYAFHQKRLNESRNKTMLMGIIKEATGHDVRIQCIVGDITIPDDTPVPATLPPADEQVHTVSTPKEPAAPPPQNEAVKAISNIFGGAELLQS